MSQMTKTTLGNTAEAAAAVGSGFLETVYIGLYTDGPTPAVGLALSSFTEVSLVGYARSTVVWNGPIDEIDGTASVVSDLNFWATSDTIGASVKGALLIGSDSLTLLGAEEFDTPQPLDPSGHSIAYVSKFNFGKQPDMSNGVVV